MNPMIDKLLTEETFLKNVGAGHGKYVIYNREWLFEHLEEEFELLKDTRENRPLKPFSREEFERWMSAKFDNDKYEEDE